MDGGAFDRLTRLLAGRLTRRSGLAAAATAAALTAPAAAEARRRHGNGNGNGNGAGGGHRKRRGNGRGDGRGPRPEGPCGDGSRKENVCTKDSQCCTGYCKTSLGKKNVDRKGRCRCVRRGKPCTPKQTCCGKTTCANGTCASAAVCAAAGGACASDAACCSGLYCDGAACAACTPETCRAACPYTDDPAVCVGVGGACAGDSGCCGSLLCKAGACAACAPDVCANGCKYETVEEAWAAAEAGDTIYIGAGEYPTAITIDKNITLVGCPAATEVKLTAARPDPTPADTYFSILADDPNDSTVYTVTLRNLVLEGTNYPTDSYDALLRSERSESINWTVEDCTLRNAYYGVYAAHGNHRFIRGAIEGCAYGAYLTLGSKTTTTSLEMTCVTVTGNDTYGVYSEQPPGSTGKIEGCMFRDNPGEGLRFYGDAVTPPQSRLEVTGCTFSGHPASTSCLVYGGVATFTGCTITGNDAGGLFLEDCDAEIIDTSVTANNSTLGAGIYILARERSLSTLTLSGTTQVTGNDADEGGGIYLDLQKPPSTYAVNGAETRVFGNVDDQCNKSNQTVNCGTWLP